MNKSIELRAWTGKKWFYQEEQYLGSFVRRAVSEIGMDTTGKFNSGHESYLPNGGNIEEYLYRFSGVLDKHGKKIFEGDIVEYKIGTEKVIGDVRYDDRLARFVKRGQQVQGSWEDKDLSSYIASMKVIGNIKENPDLLQG